PMVNNLENFRTSVEHELSYLALPGNAKPEQITTTWEAIATNLQKHEQFGQELERKKYFEAEIDEVLTQSLDPVQRIYNIHHFVKNRMKWDGKYGILSSGNLKRNYENRIGSVADINLMLTAMLRYAGFYANPVLVSTRSNGIPISVTTAGFNYVVCAVKHQEQFILLDATSPHSLPDILPERSLNWFGRMIDPNGFSEQIDFMPSTVSNQRINLQYSIDENGEVIGKYRCQYDNHLALEYRTRFSDTNKDSYVSFIENTYNSINISEYNEENVNDLSRPVMESFSFSTSEAVDIVDDKLFLKPMLFLTLEENPFKQDDRAFPIDFTYPVTSRYLVTINIPEGYTVDWMPESTTLALPNNAGSFKYMCQKSGNAIQLSITRSINSPVLPESYYAAVKELYNQVIEKETERIILIKT
ncbi:MAG: transglutaminase, partial [Flavobacteriaceae bacterium]|nr:transglutaminase [Flavobacteriaceae bacterium]